MLKIRLRFLLFILALAIVGCAKRGNITGGLKDTIPPVLRSSSPPNYSTNFNVKEIRITFDEYIKIKDVNKQLIVSPPMVSAPTITPTNASKFINIKIKDTLKPNTTYSFNFGSSIQDNNEGNPYQQFKYVFSTGTYIDSLEVSGTVKDAINKNVENFVSIMLYEIDEKFTDSIVYKENPRYITNTLDSLKTFKLENLKEGKYMLVAMKDYNNNFKFNANKDKIAFRKQPITVPTDSVFELKLFNEIPAFKGQKPYQASGNRLVIPYEGNADNLAVTLKNESEAMPIKLSKFPEKDSLQIWFKPLKVDSLGVSMKKDFFEKEFYVRIKDFKKDTLSFTPKQKGILHPRERFTINSSLPLTNIDKSKINLINKDSVAVAFTTEYKEMSQDLLIDFPREELQTYSMQLLPGALTSYLETANDTLKYTLKTQSSGDYGNLKVVLQNANRFPIIVELTNPKGEIIASEYTENETVLYFNGLQPGTFLIRAIYDDNKNKIWDTGNYLENRQPEEVIYYQDPPNKDQLDVRTNWEVEQDFNLSP
jgi:uncharacterized protein (DUF2141 family)